jgi:CRISPR/Cas system-associated exonuclease Cas4 (RecB family)
MNKDYNISRSKIDLFIECPRCFYLDVNGLVKRPSGPGFSLNSAVDELLKKEFDLLRKEQKPHSLMEKYGIKAVPYEHPELDKFRHNFTGVRFKHENGITFFGAVDDLWINENGEIHVVDYKSTSTSAEVTLEGEYKEGYKRQIEIYQYLLSKIGFKVSNIGYFVYANARKDLDTFNEKLIFDVKILTYEANNNWVEGIIEKIHSTLENEDIPLPNEGCKYCEYIKKYNDSFNQQLKLF